MTENQSILVDPAWLAKNIDDPRLVILDASMAMPGTKPDPTQAITTIPNAIRFDIDGEFSQANTPFPHMLPSEEDFTNKVQKLGINNDSQVVVFDSVGIFSAPRAWWMFRAMGHNNVSLLNGGLPAWQAAGLNCANEYKKVKQFGDFKAHQDTQWFVSMPAVETAIAEGNVVIVDARSADRFHSRVDEPRPEIRRGNIPTSLNLPFDKVLKNGCYKAPATIEVEFNKLNIDKNSKIYFSCGSGVTACIDAAAALLCGFENVSVYDGSWCEWATCNPE